MGPRQRGRLGALISTTPRLVAALATAAVGLAAGAVRAAEPSPPPVDGPRPALAATPSADPIVQRWGLREGLPQSSVTSLLQSPDGFIWVTTFGGLARFDGMTFVVYDIANSPTLKTNRFISSHVDRAGTLWFGGQNGELTRRRNGVFENVSLPPGVHDSIFAMDDDPDGTLWIGATSGVFVVRGDHVERATLPGGPHREVGGVLARGDGGVWIATRGGPICVVGACARDGRAPGPEGELFIGDVTASAVDGTRWFVDATRVWTAPPSGGPPVVELALPPSSDGLLRALALDLRRGRTWVAAGQELLVKEGKGAAWRSASEHLRDLFADHRDAIRSLLVDREGGLWIGTDRGGLVRMQDADTLRYGARQGLDTSTFAVLEDRAGRIWATGNCAGPFVQQPGGPFELVPGERPRCAHGLAVAPDGAVWVGDDGRLLRYAAGQVDASPLAPLPLDARVIALAFDRDGALWAGTERDGLARLERDLDGSYHVVRNIGEDGLGDAMVLAIVPSAPGDGLWIGTSAGAAFLDATQHIRRLRPEDGLARGAIRDILPMADGTVWFGSYGGGLSRLKDGRLTTLTTRGGLCDDTVSRLLPVGAELWMNGNRGVFHVPFADLEGWADGARTEVRCILRQSGEGNGGTAPAGWAARDGRLWFPTIDGLVAVDPRPRPGAEVPPLAAIDSVTLDGQPLALRGDGPIEIGPDRGDLVVHYTGLAFDAPSLIRFRHRLVGGGGEWIEAGAGRAASFARLAPGDFVFEVEAQGFRGVWSPPARVALHVDPHLWERPWFQLSVALGALAFALGLFQLRLLGARRRNQALQAEVVERQRAEALAREQEHHYRMLFENTTEGLFVHDARGRLVEVNAAGTAFVGLERDRLREVGLGPFLAAESRERYAAMVLDAASGRAPQPLDVELEVQGGERRALRFQAAAFDIRGAAHAICTAIDLTAVRRAEAQRREYEERLQQGQKLEALGLLASGIAHDFNNHLAAIGTSTALIRERTDNPELAAYAADIGTTVVRASALVHKLLAFGRQQPGYVRVIDASAAIEQLMPMLGRLVPPEVHVTCKADGPPTPIRVDPVLLEQAIINLVVNARDAMPRGGTIALHVARREVDAAMAGLHRVAAGPYAVIAVNDTGTGMDAATRARIFDPFFTTKALGKGTGLGLSVTHATVEKAGGFITVDSTVGLGTTLALHVPLVDAPVDTSSPPAPASPAPAPAPAPTSAPPAATLRILLCEDDEVLRRATKRMLELRGYAIVDAEAPEVALAAFEADPGTFALALSDVVLPGFSGAELAHRVRAIRPELPIVLMSGHTRDVAIEGLGPHDELVFLKKPFTIDELAQAIRSALTGASERAAGRASGATPSGL